MSLSIIKVNDNQVIGIDNEPILDSENLVNSGGVYNKVNNVVQTSRLNDHALSFSDEAGYSIMDIEEDGNIKTIAFDSTKIPDTSLISKGNVDFAITDENKNGIVLFSDGHVKTKNFDSKKLSSDSALMKDLSFCDENDYSILDIADGHIKTKYFDSSKFANIIPEGLIKVPLSSIPVYITCNDLNKTNSWGIGSRNKSLSIWLDHFFNTDKELAVYFDNGSTYHTISQKIIGNGSSAGWNNNTTKYEYTDSVQAGSDTLNIKVRSILNSATKNIFPKVLAIGDSVTEGWFANYPIVTGAPILYWSWMKYYFEKDKVENGGLYSSLFVGTGKNSVNYDGVSYNAYAYGNGGKTAKWFVTSSDSPFHVQTGFSLQSYLNKYKTLADDGTTRLVPGSTAGSEVTNANAWDLCTPNVVIVQLGMNDVLSEWKTYMPLIVSSIKSEFPSMKIIISVLDGCTCNYPSLYPNYSNIFFDNYNNDHTKLMDAYCYALDNWQNESNGIYVIYSGMVMPMPISCNVRVTEGNFDGNNKHYVGVDSIERVPHPSRYAHQEIGYLLYSAIKWILI